jgi:hypothetical protein
MWWNQNKKSSDYVKEEPCNRQAEDHSGEGHEPPSLPFSRIDCNGSPLKASRAQIFTFMLCDAFPAEVVSASRTTGNGLAIRVDQASLSGEVHGGWEFEQTKDYTDCGRFGETTLPMLALRSGRVSTPS